MPDEPGATPKPLPDAAFVVLALLAEGESYGYEIQKRVHDRGFRFWTNLQRSSIYNALALLEKERLVSARMRSGAGPARKTYRITRRGAERLRRDGLRHLTEPDHPRSEIDLGVYALPFLPRPEAAQAFEQGLRHLRGREAFLKERLAWCTARGLTIPALAFERPLLALQAEITWLERVAAEYRAGAEANPKDWTRYVYRDPPAG